MLLYTVVEVYMKKALKWSAVFIFLYIFYLVFYTGNFTINSDTITPFIIADDFLNGNYLLKGWYASTRQFILETFFLIIPYSIFNSVSDVVTYYTPFLISILMILMYKTGRLGSKYKNYLYVLLFISLAGIIPADIMVKYLFIPSGFHNEMYLLLILLLYLLDKYRENSLSFLLIIFAVSFFISLDPLSIYIFLLPLLIVVLIRIFLSTAGKKLFIRTAVILSAFVTGKIFGYLVSYAGGIKYDGYGFSFVEYEETGSAFVLFVKNMIMLFNGFFFGERVSFNSVSKGIGVLIFIAGCYAVFHVLKNFRKQSLINQLMSISLIIYPVLLMLTGIAEWYFVPVFLFMILLILRTDFLRIINKNYAVRNDRRLFAGIFILIIFVVVLNGYRNFPKEAGYFHQDNESSKIADLIISNNLKKGYAEFWDAGVMAYYTGMDITIAPVGSSRRYISEPYYWLSKKEWYDEDRNFIVANSNNLEKFIKHFGEPDKKYYVEDEERYLLIYNKNLSKELEIRDIKNSLNCTGGSIKKDGMLYLYTDAVCKGPYLSLEKGRYRIEIRGRNLKNLEMQTGVAGIENGLFELENLKISSKFISYEINVKEKTDYIEFRLNNAGQSRIIVESILKEPIK